MCTEDFNIGDRVVCVDDMAVLVDHNSAITLGMTGTVRAFSKLTDVSVGVEWDEDVGGHDLNGALDRHSGRGYFVRPEALALFCDTLESFDARTEITDLL